MMYRMAAVLWVGILCAITPLVAQVDTLDDEPIPPPHHSQVKIGGAIGFTQNVLFLNLDPLNNVITAHNGAPLSKNPMFMMGGQIYIYTLFVQNLRIGGIWMGGSMDSRSVDTAANISRTVNCSVGYSGFQTDYVVPLVPRLDLTFGLLLGGGTMSMRITRDHGNLKTWDGIWSDLSGGNAMEEVSHQLTGTFFVYQPSVGLEYAILRNLGVRLGVSYLGMAGGSWNLDDQSGFDVTGVPSDISGRGFVINGGIYLGTFIF